MHLSAEAVGFVPALALGYALVARVEPPGRFRLAAAAAALALILAAFVSELQPLALHTFLWAHLLQNVVLAEWAPALLVLAVPRARPAGRTMGRAAPCRRLAVLDPDLPRLAPAMGLRLRPAAPAFVAARRACDVPRRRHRALVARRAWHTFRGRKGCVSLRRVRACVADRIDAGTRAAPGVLVLRARAAHVGAGTARRSADRGRDGGGRAGRRLLRDPH